MLHSPAKSPLLYRDPCRRRKSGMARAAAALLLAFYSVYRLIFECADDAKMLTALTPLLLGNIVS